jgi:prepilin peptidase CpaA
MAPVSLILFALFPAMIIVAALRDLTSFTIPNWVSLAAAASFVPAAFVAHPAMGALALSVGVGLTALVLGIVMFSFGWIGGGDAKLFAACALWLGWPAVAPFMIYTSLAGGLLAIGLLWARNMAPRQLVLGGPSWAQRLMRPNGDVPYGLAIAAGALMAFPGSALLHG